jgi:sugar-specific transcriptional regulator TrmB
MELQDKYAQTLCKLGLTPLQAKTYLTLIHTGREKIQTISKIAHIDRSNTYQTINQLQKMDLIERIIDSPNLYQASPLEDAVSSLLRRKQDQYSQIQKDAQELMPLIHAKDTTPEKEEQLFKIFKKQEIAAIKNTIADLKKAQESFDILITKKTLFVGIIGLEKDQLPCVKRGIKYRMVTEKIDSETIQEKLRNFLAEPNFKIRYILKAPRAELIIRDKKTAHVGLLPNSGIGDTPYMETDHPGFLEMFQTYFDKIWNEAQEYKLKNNRAISKKIANKVSSQKQATTHPQTKKQGTKTVSKKFTHPPYVN